MGMHQKISTRSAVFFTLTSMLGAGIFIKTQTLNVLSHGRIAPIFLVFFLFLISILSFSYVLMKIIPSQTGDMGFMEWSKNFCGTIQHSAFCNFIRHIYYPVSIILFSVYGVLSITGEQLTVFPTLIVALIVALFFILLNFISFDLAKKVHFVLSILVLIPLLLLPIVALAYPGGTDDVNSYTSLENTSKWTFPAESNQARGLDSLGPWMILISGFPSLLFIYDGFYNITPLKSRMKDPKKMGFVILTGMGLVTLIYLWVIISFNVGDPVNASYHNFRGVSRNGVLYYVFEICVSAASFLTLNSIIIGGLPQLSAMHKVHRFADLIKAQKTIFYKKYHSDKEFEERFLVMLFLVFKVIVGFIVAWFLLTVMTHSDLEYQLKDFLNALADMVTVFVFLILLAVIIGSYKNRSYKLSKDKWFKVCVRISGASIILSMLYLFLSYLVGVTGYGESNVLSSGIKLLILLIFSVGIFSRHIRDFLYDKFGSKNRILHRKAREGSLITIS